MNSGSSNAGRPRGDSSYDWTATRRSVLAAGGVAMLGGLAGCSALDGVVDRASDQVVQNKTASPAGFYTGAESLDISGTLYRSGPADVRFVPPTLRAQGQQIDIDGWSTSSTTKAQDYNSSRSNKPRTVWVPNPDGDSDDDGILDGTLVEVLDIERALLVYADAAIAAVEEESSDDATTTLDAFINATTKARSKLEKCSSETCVTVSDHADQRLGLAADAREAVEAGEWDAAQRSMQEARRIVQGDIENVRETLDEELAGQDTNPLFAQGLMEYLGGNPTIGERFVVSLPNARPRGDRTTPLLYQRLSPQRVFEYFLGEHDAEGCAERDGPVSVHRDLACRDLLTSTLRLDDGISLGQLRGIDENDIRRSIAAFETSDGVIVTGATPGAEATEPMLRVSEDGSAAVPETLDSWGEATTVGEAEVSPVLVVPVAATPPDCPSPLPALLYVRRVVHDGQLLFVGGWHVDDGALYEDSATLLTADSPNVVAGVTLSDIEERSLGDWTRLEPGARPGRNVYGNTTLQMAYDQDSDVLPAGTKPACPNDGRPYCWGVQSHEALARDATGTCPYTDSAPTAIVTALDAPILHLVDAADASNDVKFKAGAELSKAVN